MDLGGGRRHGMAWHGAAILPRSEKNALSTFECCQISAHKIFIFKKKSEDFALDFALTLREVIESERKTAGASFMGQIKTLPKMPSSLLRLKFLGDTFFSWIFGDDYTKPHETWQQSRSVSTEFIHASKNQNVKLKMDFRGPRVTIGPHFAIRNCNFRIIYKNTYLHKKIIYGTNAISKMSQKMCS